MKRNNIKFSTFFIILYFLIAPFEYSLNIGFGTILKYLASLYVVSFIFDIVLYKISLRIKFFQILAFFLLILSYLSYFWARIPELVIEENTAQFFLISFFLVTSFQVLNKKEVNFLENTVIMSGLILMVYIYILFSLGLLNEGRLTLNEGDDPNALAALLFLPSIVTLNKARLYKNYVFIFLLIFFLIASGIVLTGSRGALFSIIFIFILYTFDVLIRERKINYKLLVLSLYFLVIFLFNSLVPVSLYSRFINNDFITNEFLNPYSRTNIWKTIMNNIIPEMPFLGYGSGNAYFIVGEYMGIPLSSHNLIFDILLQFGFLGVIIFLSFLISLFLFLLKYKQHHLIFAFIGILLVTIFLEGLSKKYFWNVIIFSVLTNHNFSIKEI